jgi:membrane protein DedA with SNARE-associated domain
MPAELAAYIIKYGYLTIFSLVFLQEIGVPNPVTNELVLLFSGYLAYTHQLNLIVVIITVVLADFTGTTLLYIVFYYFGERLLNKKPKWLPMEKIEKLKQRVERGGMVAIYAGRLLPYVRGYTSVAAGLLEIRPRVFLTAVLLSAITWSGGYVIVGFAFGSRWNQVISKLGFGEFALASVVILFLVVYVLPKIYQLVKYITKRRT